MSGTKKLRKITGPNTIQQLEHCDASDSKKVIMGGLVAETIFASLAAATQVGANKTVLVTNDSGGTVYIATGDATVAVPLLATGIAVLNQTQAVIGMGADTHIRASAAVQGVVLAD